MSNALIKHFNIADSELAEIQKSLKQNQTLLDALFEKNLLDSSAYLAWAKEHYSLPVLKAAFLEKNDNVAALLGRYKNVFPKNVIPFHEMDGVLYVMCLEPTPFDAPQPIQYVLAPYEIIAKYAVTNDAAATTVPVEEPEDLLVKENTNPLFKNLETSPSAPQPEGLEGLSFENISVGDDTGGPQLEGLNLSQQEEDKLQAAPTPEGELPEISLEAKKDVPAGLSFPETPSGESSVVTDQPVSSVDLDSFKFENIAPATETPVAPAATEKTEAPAPTPSAEPTPVEQAPQVPPAPTATAAPQPKATPAAKQSSSSLDDFVVKPKAKPAQPTQANPSQPANAQPAPVSKPVANPATAGSEKFSRTLDSLKKYFEQAMVLEFNNGILQPVAWDETWAKVTHSQAAIDVTTPSIFRIVNESHEAYHGYIVPNPVNDAFFATWNKGQTPEHITICPILVDKKVCGMVLGVTTPEGAKKYQLHHIQQIANEAAVQIAATKAA